MLDFGCQLSTVVTHFYSFICIQEAYLSWISLHGSYEVGFSNDRYLNNTWKIERKNGEGNGTPLQYSCLESPMDGGAWWAAVYGISQSRTWLKRLSSSSSYKHNLKDIVGLVSDHHNKANIAMKWVNFFGFPVHMKVMFTLYCSLFSVQ